MLILFNFFYLMHLPALWTSTGFPQELPERDRNGWKVRWCIVWCDRRMPYPTTHTNDNTVFLTQTNSVANCSNETHLPPVPLAGRARGRHLGFLLAFLQLLAGQDHLAGVITAFWTVPAKHKNTSPKWFTLQEFVQLTNALRVPLNKTSKGDWELVYQSSSSGMVVSGGFRQYVWNAMSHSSQSNCLSGSCFTPHTWQLHMRQFFFGSSLHTLHSGPFDPEERHGVTINVYKMNHFVCD